MAKRSDTDKAIRNIMKWAVRPDWTDEYASVMDMHLRLTCDALGMPQDELAEQMDANNYGAMLYGVVFEDFLTQYFGKERRNIVDDYLKRRGWRESVPAQRYLRDLKDSVLSLYEIVAISPGQHCDLVDLVRGGEPMRVYERMGTQNLVKWGKIAARVLVRNGKNIFSGGLLPFPPEEAAELLEDLKAVRARSELGPDEDILQKSASLFTGAWINTLFAKPSIPDMVNADGEALQFCETRFPYETNQRTEIIRRLERDSDWEPDVPDGSFWTWFAKAETVIKKPLKGVSFETLQEGERPTSGTLEIKAGFCLLGTNSLERSERGQKAVAQLLHGLVGTPLSVVQTPEQMMAEDDGDIEDDTTFADEIGPAAAAEIVRNFMDKHYRKCLDDTIPILDNKSPRECVKTKAGTKKVIEWLKSLENHELHRVAIDGQEPYDMSWMWDELGLKQ